MSHLTECENCGTLQPNVSTFCHGCCELVAGPVSRHAPELLGMLGLVEHSGKNTRKDTHSDPTPVTRKPLWHERIVTHLSTGHMQRGI